MVALFHHKKKKKACFGNHNYDQKVEIDITIQIIIMTGWNLNKIHNDQWLI